MIDVSNSIWVLALYLTYESSFTSIQFLFLNLNGVLSNKFILFWYAIIILLLFCFSSVDLCLFLGISLSCSFLTIYELSGCEVFETFVILSAILLPIKSPVVPAVFDFFSLWISCTCIYCRLFSMIKKFLAAFPA